MKLTLRLLALLGIVAQALLVYSWRYELAALAHGGIAGLPPEAAPIFLAPSILGLGGPAAARALYQRRSGWAWPVAVVPLVILLMGYGAALYLTFNPPPMHGGSEGLPL